jgi:hypothetical protein
MPGPAQVVTAFQKRITTAFSLYDELVLAVHQKTKQKSLESLLAEQFVLGLAVLWEAFIHDLIVAYIEDRSDVCIRFHRDKVTQSIEAKNKAFSKWVVIEVPPSLTREQIELMLDPEGWNITADSAETLAKRANQLLSAPHAIKFSLADSDRKFVDLLIAIRNYLSHRSSGSLVIMKQRIKELQKVDATSPLNGTVTTVGAYLKARPAGVGLSRANIIGNNLGAVAAKLA